MAGCGDIHLSSQPFREGRHEMSSKSLLWLLVGFFVCLFLSADTSKSHIEEEASTGKMPPLDLTVSKSVGHFLNQ